MSRTGKQKRDRVAYHFTGVTYDRAKADAHLAIFNIVRIGACVIAFVYCSQQQYLIHQYLAGLKEYKVPDHPIFIRTNAICPHYTFETYIYLVLAVLTARDGRVLNITMLCATAFVLVNLGVTADLTKTWQLRRFPKQRATIVARNRMFSFW